MAKKQSVALPWTRLGHYFDVEGAIAGQGLLAGRWTTSTQDVDNDGKAEVTTTRTRDAAGRVNKIEVVNSRNPELSDTYTLAYDAQGRVTKLDIQESQRPRSTTYEYDAYDQMTAETLVVTNEGVTHTFTARHLYDRKGNVLSSVVTKDGTIKVEERTFTPSGMIKSSRVFSDSGELFHEQTSTFDHRDRIIRINTRQFLADGSTGKTRVTSDSTETFAYHKTTQILARKQQIDFREFEKPAGVFTLNKAFEETRTFAPRGGGVEHFEQRTFNPGDDGKPVETQVRIEDITYDDQNRQILHTGTNTDKNTGESKSLRTVTAYRNMVVSTTDLSIDGTDDEESITITDEANHVVESRQGKPGFGPFTTRQKLIYNDKGELARRTLFDNNSDTPSSVTIFS